MSLWSATQSPESHVGSPSSVEQQARSAVVPESDYLGPLLCDCQSYLLEIANKEVPAELRPHIAPSDLVQETFADAIQASAQFRGGTKAELLGWLRRTLLHNITDAHRYFFVTKKRQAGRVQSLDSAGAGRPAARQIPGTVNSPSSNVRRREDALRLHAAIDRLPADYRLVIRKRHFEGLPLEAIGQEMGRSSEAVRKLWFRAVEKLADLVDDESQSSAT